MFKMYLSSLIFLQHGFRFILVYGTVTVFCAVVGESRTNHCRVNNCAQSYNRVNSRLEVAEKRKPDVDFSKRRCRILNNLHRCLHRTGRGCRGDLLFHSLQRVTDTNLERANCTFEKTLPLVSLRTIRNATIEHPDLSSSVVQESSECFFKTEPNFRHCGMFGDPHIRTFSDRFYTCNVEKAWHLIDNEYMVVMATNVPVKEGSEATVTTKVFQWHVVVLFCIFAVKTTNTSRLIIHSTKRCCCIIPICFFFFSLRASWQFY